MKSKKTRIIGICTLFFLVYVYIFWKLPYCHDEWHWGLPSRIELMKNFFQGYNGRYLGDVLAIAVTRSLFAKSILMALVMVGLLVIMMKVGRPKTQDTHPFYWLSCVLFLLAVPKTLFCQSYGWIAAFVNFVPPVLLFLIYFVVDVQPLIYDDSAKTSIPVDILLVLICISAQFFSEHNTIFHVIFAVFVCVYSMIRIKKIRFSDILCLAAFMIGAVLMFINAAYKNAADDTDGYKHIWFSISKIVHTYAHDMSDQLFLNNWLINGVLVILLCWLLVQVINNKLVASEMILVMTGYEVFSIWHKIYPSWTFLGTVFYDECIRAALGIIFYFHVLAAIHLIFKEKERMLIEIFYLSVAIEAAPLLMANPIGARCFYASYCFQIVVILLVMKHCFANKQSEEGKLYYPEVAACAAVLCISFIYVWMFREIGRYNDVRARNIQYAIENELTFVELPKLPYSEFVWTTIPQNDTWARRFKLFYGLNPDVGLEFYETGK